MRVLLIDDDPTGRKLMRQHILTAFDAPRIVEHVPKSVGRLPAEFAAAGYDAVLLDATPAGGAGLEWLADGRARPLFPPVIYLLKAPEEKPSASPLVLLGAVKTAASCKRTKGSYALRSPKSSQSAPIRSFSLLSERARSPSATSLRAPLSIYPQPFKISG